MNDDNEFRGTKYSPGLNRVTIAKLVRVDVKAAMKQGVLPKGIKVSVRCSGSSIRATITAYPGPVLNPAWVFANSASVFEPRCRALHTAPVMAACAVLESILRDYLRDASDIQTDYFNCNFYSSVSVDTDNNVERDSLLESPELADLKVAKAAGRDVTGQLNAYDTSGNQ